MVSALVGTDHGLVAVDREGDGELQTLAATAKDAAIVHLTRESMTWYAVADEGSILRASKDGRWEQIAMIEDGELVARCLSPHSSGVLIGTSEAHLLRFRGGRPERVDPFEQVKGREEWYTPWGGPPDVRSISIDQDGTIYVNVHVGGVVRSPDGGKTWGPTMDIDMDVHQVIAHPNHRGHVFVASARGLGVSEDGGRSWTFSTDGLHAPYCRAVAVCGGHVLVSASSGPRGKEAAVYRRHVDGSDSFEKCREGLPEWFDDNIDTFCLAARDRHAVFGTEEGAVFVSADEGNTWQASDAVQGRAVRCIALS